mgnify:CR=1 FL=1
MDDEIMKWLLPGGVGVFIIFIGGVIRFLNRSQEVPVGEFPGLVRNFVVFLLVAMFVLGIFASLREWFTGM